MLHETGNGVLQLSGPGDRMRGSRGMEEPDRQIENKCSGSKGPVIKRPACISVGMLLQEGRPAAGIEVLAQQFCEVATV